jgi:tRNA threonylcarbamoyladenosine biosynthesis protein TsaB
MGAYKDMTQKAIRILALDTALNACSVALTKNTEILASYHEVRSRGHAESLLPTVKELMAEANLEFSDLDMIAVSVGPGTFTGLRIGLSAARAMALAAGIPCVGITTLNALAAAVPSGIAENRTIVATADARRKEVYLQNFRYVKKDKLPSAASEPCAVPILTANTKLLDGPLLVLGGGSALLQEANAFSGRDVLFPDLNPNPDAKVIAQLALAGGVLSADTPPPAPVYLRGPDAKLPGGKEPPTPYV